MRLKKLDHQTTTQQIYNRTQYLETQGVCPMDAPLLAAVQLQHEGDNYGNHPRRGCEEKSSGNTEGEQMLLLFPDDSWIW